MIADPVATDPEPPLILFDGVCGLCSRSVRFVLRRDRGGQFRFAALQSDLAATILRRHGRDPDDLDTVVVVLDRDRPTERLLIKARAGLFVLGRLGGVWSLARPLGVLPSALLNLGYDVVARNRYRVFGKQEGCSLPTPEQRARFLDLNSTAEATGP